MILTLIGTLLIVLNGAVFFILRRFGESLHDYHETLVTYHDSLVTIHREYEEWANDTA